MIRTKVEIQKNSKIKTQYTDNVQYLFGFKNQCNNSKLLSLM